MQLRAFLPYLLIFNSLGYQPLQADASGATNTTVQTDLNTTAPSDTIQTSDSGDSSETTTDTAVAANPDTTASSDATDPSVDSTVDTAGDNTAACECPSWNDNSPNDENESWIPTFIAPATLPSYQDIIACTVANEASFAAELATANQALKAYLEQCIMNGSCDEEQVAALVNAVQGVYKAYVRQSAFLAYLKAQRLQDEAEYQAYQTQLAALQASIQQAAQQAIAAWQAVAAGKDTVSDALAVSQSVGTAITTTQGQIDQVNAQINALLVLLATDENSDCPVAGE